MFVWMAVPRQPVVIPVTLTRGRRVKVDAGRLEVPFRFGSITFRIVARQVAPCSHRAESKGAVRCILGLDLDPGRAHPSGADWPAIFRG